METIIKNVEANSTFDTENDIIAGVYESLEVDSSSNNNLGFN